MILTAQQLRLGLPFHGVALSAIEALVDALPDEAERALARAGWEHSPFVARSHPLVNRIGELLSLTPLEIDAMWYDIAARFPYLEAPRVHGATLERN